LGFSDWRTASLKSQCTFPGLNHHKKDFSEFMPGEQLLVLGFRHTKKNSEFMPGGQLLP
jgi:2-keto-3-deoxy-galactonokinase